MKKNIITYLLLILMPLLLWSQKNTDTVLFRKHIFSFEFGGHYNYFFGDTYILPYKYYKTILREIYGSKYDGFSKLPNTGIQFGFFYDYKIFYLQLEFVILIEELFMKVI